MPNQELPGFALGFETLSLYGSNASFIHEHALTVCFYGDAAHENEECVELFVGQFHPHLRESGPRLW